MKTPLSVHLALFAVSLIYGATFTIAKQVMPIYVKPFAFILLRVIVAACCIFIFHSIFVKKKITDKKDFLQLGISALFGVAFNMLLFFKGLSITTPIITGVFLAALGAILLMGGTEFNFSSDTVWGDVMVTANAIIYAFYLVYAKSLMQKYHPLTVTMWSFVFGFFVVLPFGGPEFMEINFSSFTPAIWMGVAFVTIGSTFLTYVLNAYALQKASSSLVGSYIYLQPVLATIIAILTAKDKLTLSKGLCMLVIFGGVYLVSKRKKELV